MKIKICCQDLEEEKGQFDIWDTGKVKRFEVWHDNMDCGYQVFCDIRFCPFCGKRLEIEEEGRPGRYRVGGDS